MLILLAIGPFCVCVCVCVRAWLRARVWVLAAGVLLNGSASCRRTDLTFRNRHFLFPSLPCPHPLETSVYTNTSTWIDTYLENYACNTHARIHIGLSCGQQLMQELRHWLLCNFEWRVGFFFFLFATLAVTNTILNKCYCMMRWLGSPTLKHFIRLLQWKNWLLVYLVCISFGVFYN